MFKLSITAGHYKNTPGKRCHVDIDPNQTREWVLNSRIAEKVEALLKTYDGIEILRTDDRTGNTDVSLQERTNKANNFGADFYLSIHHNAAGKKFDGGGIVTYVYTSPDAESLAWQKDFYNALISKTGLKGNRSTPLAQKNLHEVRESKMSSVLLELGFMDSTVDCPIILTEDYANKCAEAIVEVIVNRAKLTKKATNTSKRYYVRVGAIYKNKANADNLLKKVKDAGFDAVVVTSDQIESITETKTESTVKIEIKVGSTVKVKQGAKTYTGGSLAPFVYERNHQVKQINVDRVVITYNGEVVAAVRKSDLILIK